MGLPQKRRLGGILWFAHSPPSPFPLPLLHQAYQGRQFGMTRVMGSSDMFQIRSTLDCQNLPQDCFPPATKLAKLRAGQRITLTMIFGGRVGMGEDNPGKIL